MLIFTDVKDHLNAREVAEYYGLKINRNGMACCPFHDDHTPSMKLDKRYYCFGCGASGDVINYVAQTFGLSQYDAACKLVSDFQLPIAIQGYDHKALAQAKIMWRREQNKKKRADYIKRKFQKWCNEKTDDLRDCMNVIDKMKELACNMTSEELFNSNDYMDAMQEEALVNYWLDILCTGTDEERRELFIGGRKEVEGHVKRMREIRDRVLGSSWSNTGCRIQHCG